MAQIGDGGPRRVETMMVASEPSHLGERLRSPKTLAMNSRLTKKMDSSRENPPHIKCSPFAVTVIADEGTIRMSRGKARCKIPLPGMPTIVVFCTSKIRVVKIVHSSFEMV
jgi:hypothetical protein